MRVQTRSACAVLAWGILLAIILLAVSTGRPTRQPPAHIATIATTATTTATTATTATGIITTSAQPATPAAANAPVTPAAGAGTASPAGMDAAAATAALAAPAAPAAHAARESRVGGRYVVQPGDTLSGIATRLGVPGGWPALYAANQAVIGPDPDIIDPGTVLVLPAHARLTRYTIAPGDTLTAIAAALGVRGGWPALYTANRAVIGPDPALIHPGTALTIPAPPTPAPPPASRPAPLHPHPAPAASPAPGSTRQHRRPVQLTTPNGAGAGLPAWLKTTLLAAGLIIGAAFITEPLLAAARRPRRPARAARTTRPAPGTQPGTAPARPRPTRNHPRILITDHDRVVVSYNNHDDTTCVLRPPGQDPRTILNAARLVLPETAYTQLAARLGVPATWPIVLADYHRVVVTCSNLDQTAYVLRPPGEDPKTVLRAARLVLPETAYAELADQLGVSASWPMEHR